MKQLLSLWQIQKEAGNAGIVIALLPCLLITQVYYLSNFTYKFYTYVGVATIIVQVLVMIPLFLIIDSIVVLRPYLFSYTHSGILVSINQEKQTISVDLEKSRTFMLKKEGGEVLYKKTQRITLPFVSEYLNKEGETISWNSRRYYGMLYVAKSKSPVAF